MWDSIGFNQCKYDKWLNLRFYCCFYFGSKQWVLHGDLVSKKLWLECLIQESIQIVVIKVMIVWMQISLKSTIILMVLQWIEALNSSYWITFIFIQICNSNSFKSFLHFFLVIHSLSGIHAFYWHSLLRNSGPKNLMVWNCMLWCLSLWQRKLL
jgi:hypothetical protein